MANTSSPTSSVFLAMRTIASMRSASVGVTPETGSLVMSLTEKIPNCTANSLSQVYAFASTFNQEGGGVFRASREAGQGERPATGRVRRPATRQQRLLKRQPLALSTLVLTSLRASGEIGEGHFQSLQPPHA